MQRFLTFALILAVLTTPIFVNAQQAAPAGGPPQQFFFKLEPPLVVNIEDGEVVRFLQVETQLQFAEQTLQALLEKHLPAIRHELVMLLSGQPAVEIKTAKGKEELRHKALAAVQKVMETHTTKPIVDALYFTTFVIQ